MIHRSLLALFCLFAAGLSVQAQTPLTLDAKNSFLKFVGESLLHDFHGEAREFSGTAEWSPDAKPPLQHAVLHIKTASLTTFHAERDKKMDAWLDIKSHPNATFRLESVKPLSGNYAQADEAHPARFLVSGTFTLNNVTQPLSGEALGWRNGDKIVVSGKIDVDTLKHGLPQIRESVLTVGTSVHVEYRLTFDLPPGTR
jgi:polyisoprenoid-binding protein YceI